MTKRAPEPKETWRTRLCAAAGVFKEPGVNVDELAMLVTAVLDIGRDRLPSLGRTATIDKQGRLRANWAGLVNGQVKRIRNMPLMSVQQYQDTYRRLGDMVCADQAEYDDLFQQFRQWVGRDMRVSQDQADQIKSTLPGLH